MTTIYLHGAMRKRFGASFELHVSTPAEAIRALGYQLPGFYEAVRAGAWRVVRGPLKGGRSLPVDQLHVNLGREMHLVAAPKGAGGKGGSTGKIIVGTLLIIAAIALVVGGPMLAGSAAAAAGAAEAGGAAAAAGTFGAISGTGLGTSVGLGMGLGSISAGKIALFGASMLFGGLSQLLAPTPKPQQSATSQQSYLFSGIPNTSDQGGPVPVLIGECRCGGILISVSVEVEDYPTTESA